MMACRKLELPSLWLQRKHNNQFEVCRFMVKFCRAVFFSSLLLIGNMSAATERSSFVLASQFFLNHLGYDAGPNDGIRGNKTNAALDQFFSSMSVDSSVEIDDRLIAILIDASRENANTSNYMETFNAQSLRRRQTDLNIRQYCGVGIWSQWFPPESSELYHEELFGEGDDLAAARYSGWPFQQLLYRNVIRDIDSNDLNLSSVSNLLLEAAKANAFTRISGHRYRYWNGRSLPWVHSYNEYNETEVQTHLVLHTVATVFHLVRPNMSSEEQDKIINWGNRVFENILQTPDDLDRWEQGRNRAHDRSAWKSMSLIAWGIEAENYLALSEGLGHFITNIDSINQMGRQNFWWKGGAKSEAQRIFYLHSTYGALTSAAFHLSALGVDGFHLRGAQGGSLFDGLTFLMPHLEIYGGYKRVTEVTRSNLQRLAYLELLSVTPYFDEIPRIKDILAQMRRIDRVPQSTSRYGLLSLDAPGYTTCWFGRLPL